MAKAASSTAKESARDKILTATLALVREKGYAATTVDALCEEAGVTKGAFFHHFKSKEDLAVVAAEHWSRVTQAFFDAAPYHSLKDPFERLMAYVALRKELLHGQLAEITCFVGTMVQEAYAAYPKIQAACYESIFGHAESYLGEIEEAKRLYAPDATWTSESLALHLQATIQGAFILTKASGKVADAERILEHLESYLELLFHHRPS